MEDLGVKERIVIYSWNIPKGGLPKVMLKEYYFFRDNGFDVTLVTSQGSSHISYFDELNKAGMIFLGSNEPKGHGKKSNISYFFPGLTVSIQDGLTSNVMKLIKFLRYQKPDIVIAHQLLSGLMLAPFCLLFRRNIVLVLHDNPYLFLENGSNKSLKKKFINSVTYAVTRLAFYYSHRIVFTSESIARNTEKHINSGGKGVVADYGIDAFPKKDLKREFVTVVSKWSRFRNPRAYLELRKLLPSDIILVMAGRWDSEGEYSEFKRTVIEAGYSESLIIKEELSEEELSELYDRTKVFVRLGFNESGTGQGILEAIGHGCPVVISKSIGASSLIQDGQQGFVVDETNLEEVAEKILHIFSEDQLFQDMVSSCYKLASSNGWTKYLNTLKGCVLG